MKKWLLVLNTSTEKMEIQRNDEVAPELTDAEAVVIAKREAVEGDQEAIEALEEVNAV